MFDVALRYVRPLSIPSSEVDNDGSLTVLYSSQLSLKQTRESAIVRRNYELTLVSRASQQIDESEQIQGPPRAQPTGAGFLRDPFSTFGSRRPPDDPLVGLGVSGPFGGDEQNACAGGQVEPVARPHQAA